MYSKNVDVFWVIVVVSVFALVLLGLYLAFIYFIWNASTPSSGSWWNTTINTVMTFVGTLVTFIFGMKWW